ncbi:MAG: M48 family metalloprotease [Prolixibacteraceae bacterium]|nr:M48 family metalloprotease [Prolixibacteraceae bacterium]
MKFISDIFSPEIIESTGWAIVHSLWQAAGIAIVLAILLLLLKRKSAQIKYFLSYAALIAVLAFSTGTFIRAYNYASEKQELKEKITSNPDYIKSLLVQGKKDKTQISQSKEEIINLRIVKVRSFFQRNFYAIYTIWLAGMVILIIRFILGFMYCRRLRTNQLEILPDEIYTAITKLSEKIGLTRKVEAFFSPLAKGPVTLGTIKPIVLFPLTAFTGLSSKEIEAIIAHELAHIMRNDYLFNIIQTVIEILFFYNPAVWIISSQIRAERENSCDNIAVEATGDKVAFVKALASIQINTYKNEQLSMAFANKRSSILQRIKRLQNQIAMKTNFLEKLIAGFIILIGITLASFAFGSQKKVPENLPVNKKDTIVQEKKMTEAEKDSIKTVLETNIRKANIDKEKKEELQKVTELALSENDEEVSGEMIEEINEAFEDVNVSEVVREAMKEVSAALREASREVNKAMREIDHEEINRDMEEAARDIEEAKREMAREMYRDMSEDGLSEEFIEATIGAASAGLDIASGVLENLDVNGIVHSALSGVSSALNSMGEEGSHHWEESDSSEENLYEEMKDELEKEKKMLEKEQEKMQKRVDKINKDLDKLDK